MLHGVVVVVAWGHSPSPLESSVEMITSVALMTATAGDPFFNLSRFAEPALMSDTI
jgi:hypothetical protein